MEHNYMECENSEGDELSMDITKTLEANKELLAHPFFNKANGSNWINQEDHLQRRWVSSDRVLRADEKVQPHWIWR